MDEVSSTRDLIVAGLRAEALRQKAIASNIANLETPGYRRVDVKFEEMLADALDNGTGKVDARQIEPEVYEPRNTPVKANGNDVSLELEIGQMVKNTLRHETLMRLLIKKVNGIDKIIDVP
jgi:flagellar basal-body rod protein FlgB